MLMAPESERENGSEAWSRHKVVCHIKGNAIADNLASRDIITYHTSKITGKGHFAISRNIQKRAGLNRGPKAVCMY